MLKPRPLFAVSFLFIAAVMPAAEPDAEAKLKAWLDRQIISPDLVQAEVEAFTEARVARVPEAKSKADWEAAAERTRREVLDQVVFRGEAVAWRDAKTKVEWLETIDGGPGYRIKKLRYEALPGLWVPALLYEPETLNGPVAVAMNVNGHDGNGKAADYKQLRCINQAKRGLLALNVEWFGMGQLRGPNFGHYKLNQIDLCGTSGIAPFYLAMKRGLDVLLDHKHADPRRVAVAGLSGGGWQTIFISSLDTRVTLTNPVAGYSSYLTRIHHHSDLGDSEQTPVDLAATGDYATLTAMMAPRAALLTFNEKDNCCFASPHALQPLLDAAGPVYKLFGQETKLRSHVNHDPGDHNFGQDNREAHYKMLADHFTLPGETPPSTAEIESRSEVKSADQLHVAMSEENADLHSLAMGLAKNLPLDGDWPTEGNAATRWQTKTVAYLRNVVRAKEYSVAARETATDEQNGDRAVFWQVKLNDSWTVPAVELTRGEPQGTTILIADGGRAATTGRCQELLAAGQRVLAVDPFYFGESKIPQRDFLFALLVSSVGERPLGVQASQLAAIARWQRTLRPTVPVTLASDGPRSSLMALIATALERNAIAGVQLRGTYGSLKQVLEENGSVDRTPELFCFGLLKHHDLRQIAASIAPRDVVVLEPSERVKQEFAGLKDWYRLLGRDFNPLDVALRGE